MQILKIVVFVLLVNTNVIKDNDDDNDDEDDDNDDNDDDDDNHASVIASLQIRIKGETDYNFPSFQISHLPRNFQLPPLIEIMFFLAQRLKW